MSVNFFFSSSPLLLLELDLFLAMQRVAAAAAALAIAIAWLLFVAPSINQYFKFFGAKSALQMSGQRSWQRKREVTFLLLL